MTRHKGAPVNAVHLLRLRSIVGCKPPQRAATLPDLGSALDQWLEGELLRHCASAYCNNVPPLPRSTIALAFSPDGRLLASTHGDHTVKITCCKTGSCLKVLRDHDRTPWAVKFHPSDPNLLASGSLDSTVKIWNLAKGECTCSHNFGRPISSIAFVPGGAALAVATGHRLYMWNYELRLDKNKGAALDGELVLMLKTRRSLRAVHFHPQGAPLMLTAEVTSSLSAARHQKSSYPLDYTGVVEGVEIQERRSRYHAREGAEEAARQPTQNPQAFGEQLSQALHALQTSSPESAAVAAGALEAVSTTNTERVHRWLEGLETITAPHSRAAESVAGRAASGSKGQSDNVTVKGVEASDRSAAKEARSTDRGPESYPPDRSRPVLHSALRPDAQPFHPQGYATHPPGASGIQPREALLRSIRAAAANGTDCLGEGWTASDWPRLAALIDQGNNDNAYGGPQGVLQRISNSGGPSAAPVATGRNESGDSLEPTRAFPGLPVQGSRQQRRASADQVAILPDNEASQTPSGADSEGRRTAVSHQRQSQRPLIGNQNPVPGVRLPPRGGSVGLTEDGRPRRLIIDRQGLPGVDPRPDLGGRSTSWQAGANEVGCCVLVRLWRYSQMGKPALEKLELAIQNAVLCSDMGVSISQCGKLLAVCASIEKGKTQPEGDKLAYHLQVYSLEGSTFGQILLTRPIRAPHCLTAIQFSPGSCHIMVAYGRRHPCLQQQLQGSGARSIVSLTTVLEVYRAKDMSLVRVLPSADDEINTALFHPFMGAGLAYGTKEGRLRILTHSSKPLLKSKKFEGQGRFEDELLAAAQEACSHTSEEEG